MIVNKSRQLAKEICKKNCASDFEDTLFRIIEDIKAHGFEISCYNGAISKCLTDRTNKEPKRIQLSSLKTFKQTVFDMFHEYGHCLSDIPEKPCLNREIEAWNRGYNEFIKYSELSEIVQEYFDYQKESLMFDFLDDDVILKSKKTFLFTEKRNTNIIIGAPHHAPSGIKKLQCVSHPVSDENTGFIASMIARMLQQSSIIACNYHIDANKSKTTDYYRFVEELTPKYLIEIHGHAGNKVGHNIIEISSCCQCKLSEEFAKKLEEELGKTLISQLSTLKVVGNFNDIHFKATDTKSITSDKWKSLHIEIPPILRKIDGETNLPYFANDFVNILVATIKVICI